MKHLRLSGKQYKKMMLILCYVIYGMFGLFLGMRTNIFNFIQTDYLNDYTHIATLILVSGVLMQIALYYAGPLSERFGFHKVLVIGVTVSVIPLSLMLFVSSAVSFDITYFTFMLGFGISMLALNLFVSHLVPERKGNALLLLHLYFSIGALIGPNWLTFLSGKGFSWQLITSFSTIPIFIVLGIMIAAIFINPALVSGELSIPQKSKDSELKGMKTLSQLKDPLIWLFVAVFLCSQIWEYGIGTWYVIFADKSHGLSSSEAALYLTIFYSSYPVVRVVFSRIIHHLNLLVVLLCAFLCCIIFGSLGMLTGRLIFYSLTGIGVSLMYPGIMAAMQNVFGGGSTKKIGFITMTGGMLQYVAIWSVGLLSDRKGIVFGFNSMLVYLFFGAAAVAVIIYKAQRLKQTVKRV